MSETALSAVFRRITSDDEPAAPLAPEAGKPSEPEFYGFADLVTDPSANTTTIVDPVPAAEDCAGVMVASETVAIVEGADQANNPDPARSVSVAAAPVPGRPRVSLSSLIRSGPSAQVARPTYSFAEAPPVAASPQPVVMRQTEPVIEPASPPSPAVSGPAPILSRAPAAARPAESERAAAAASTMPVSERNGRQGISRNRRLYRRVRIPADFTIGDVACTLIDMSIGGFAATAIAGVAPNSVVPVSLRLTIDGIEVGTQLNARIIYATETRLGGRFIDLSASQTAFLRYVVTWRGESVGMVGTTTLLDAITGGPDRLHQPGPERDNGSRERWWSGLIGRKISPPR